MSALRLDLIVRRYVSEREGDDREKDRWTWRLWSGSRVVSTSGAQLFSRRIDCARGAEVGAGLAGIEDFLHHQPRGEECLLARRPSEHGRGASQRITVRILDERTVR